MTRPIDTGSYCVRVRCPACGVVEDVAVALIAVLARTPDECKLGVKLGQIKAQHKCGQLRVIGRWAGTRRAIVADLTCPQCGHSPVWGVEVRGAYDGVLIWECPDCGHRWPRFTAGSRLERARRWIAEHPGPNR